MLVTISLYDSRFDGIGFTTFEVRDLVQQMLAKGVYTADENTSGLSIHVFPTENINANVPADPVVSL